LLGWMAFKDAVVRSYADDGARAGARAGEERS
jgi:hypothetical protein